MILCEVKVRPIYSCAGRILKTIFETDGFFEGTFPRDGAEQFNAHNESVKRIIPAEKLFVFEVGKEGWGPLCKFLEV